MTAREETMVLRDAAAVYAEGVCYGLRLALGAVSKRKDVAPIIADWQERLEVAQVREQLSGQGSI